ncbi:YraN family protein [Pelagicoccus sp. SDUM812003]|uniref:YraN family protein n=1 Tax=Pelagicoccus sp. SDUM812003 TaxID=3041267 RepID=UPI00280F9A2F|nr:YraN family protein [Pelagicoccus sp. SDUM812003]MDQ8202383.1 YraN family protein [Pelagicoccus sp. SDUM812003]
MISWFQRLLGKREADTAVIGRRGEREAEKLLKKKGYLVLARNWRSGRDEIDLICLDGKAVVFVEVRTRTKGALVSGYDSINQRKREALRRVCRNYFSQMKPKPITLRFDVVELEHEEGAIIASRHFENVPLFSKSAYRSN